MAEAAELSKFPKEIMVEVLSRLPPKSLMRFKCVCKSWQCSISNSNFAAKHLSASKRNEHPSSTTIVLKRCDGDDIHAGKKEVLLSFFDLCQRLDGDNNDHELRPILEDLYSPLSPGVVDWQRFCVSISAHCDGILCLTDGVEYIVLCNPAIKEFKCLPVPSPKLNSCGGGFGYDLKSKDYKIVRILDNGNEEYKDGMRQRVVNHPPAAQIYNLLTSSWKEIKIIDNLVTKTTIYWPQSHSIYRNGILYWCGREGFRQENYIITDYSEHEEDDVSELKDCVISFDIGNDAFQVILAPDDCNLSDCGFGLWNESIAFCTRRPWSPHPSTEEIREIWVMDDLGGGEGCWTKYLTFEPVVTDIYRQLGVFWYNEQLVTVFRSKRGVIFQEVFTKFKHLPLNTGVMDYGQAFQLREYSFHQMRYLSIVSMMM